MAIDSQDMTRWAWDTKLTTLATATTLAGATRYETEVQTLYGPENDAARYALANGGRVILKVTVRDAETTTPTDLDGVRLGIKINAVAFSDADATYTFANTGEAWVLEVWR